MREESQTFGSSYTTERSWNWSSVSRQPALLSVVVWMRLMLFYYVQKESARFFFFLVVLFYTYRAVNVFLYSRSARYASCPTCEFKAQVFFFFVCGVWLWKHIHAALAQPHPAPQSAVLFLWWWRDGWWKEIDPRGADISQADKWQPQTWKAISRLRQEWCGAKPHWFPWVSLPKQRPVPGHDIAAGVSTTSCPC